MNKQPFTPEWFANASRRDAGLGTLTNGLANWGGRYPDRFNMMGALSYITGSHNVKVGVQYNFGPYVNTRETNADLQQVYLNGAPQSVTVYNTPLRYKDSLKADIGIFLQDSWSLNRLTINTGAALGVPGARGVSVHVRPRPLRRRSEASTPSDADVEGHRAARGHRLRRLRQRQDGTQGRLQSLQRVAHDVLRQPLQPAGIDVGQPAVDRLQRQRYRRG